MEKDNNNREMTEDINDPVFYYPCCKDKRCDGILKIKINDNYSVDFECDKNENHKKKNLFFKTFERFYLKEKKAEKCSICNSNLENSHRYNCGQCKKLFCGSCFVLDEHIKNNINNLSITNQKCLNHKKEFTHYCTNCKKYLCIHCINDDEKSNIHKNHLLSNLIDLVPSENKINKIKKKIDQKLKKNEEFVGILDQWERQIIRKFKQLKQKLKDEMDLFKKMFYNLNNYFANYSYLKNFEHFYYYINNEEMNSHAKYYLYEDFKGLLDELFKPKEEKKIEVKQKELKLKSQNDISSGIIEKINDKYFFSYSFDDDIVTLVTVNDDNILQPLKKTEIIFKEKIHSISPSIKMDKIYACLSDSKTVKIFNCDLKNELMEVSDKEIIDYFHGHHGHFNKCIEISDEQVATSDNKTVTLWMKDISKKRYSMQKTFTINQETIDLLLINDKYIISSQPNEETLQVIDFNNLIIEKTLYDIDCIDLNNSLIPFKEFILVNCIKGIGLILKSTRELVQYIDFYDENGTRYKIINVDNNNFIYILSIIEYNLNLESIGIEVMEMRNNMLELIEKYNEIEIHDEQILGIIPINNKNIILWGNRVYSIN